MVDPTRIERLVLVPDHPERLRENLVATRLPQQRPNLDGLNETCGCVCITAA